MSGNGYGYYYTQNAPTFPVDPNQTWEDWSMESQQYANAHNMVQQNHSNLAYLPSIRNHAFYTTNPRQYPQRRFNGNQPPNWSRNSFNKRPRQDNPGDGEARGKNSKKRKKPLSQNIPSKKDWSMEEAEAALSVEKEYNKRYKNHSLIIKFPDLELNRDIVTKFHSSIESVHFQQPSTPRFCFVTLQETADADAVIGALNKIKFGDGHLTAEYKKDREDDQNITAEDIDPCTLYVGNLAQEITKEDMVKTYPMSRRIDIGYAKKMKYTRYAFVSFKNVTDSIEAFKKTHSTQMYSKSLIVRFRRLHGTVGMPGESKPQSPAKNKNDTPNASTSDTIDHELNHVTISEASEPEKETNPINPELNLSVVKQEMVSSDDDDDDDSVSNDPKNNKSPFMQGSIDELLEQHRPMTIKTEIKKEPDDNDDVSIISDNRKNTEGLEMNGPKIQIKTELNTKVKREGSDDDGSSDNDDDDDDEDDDENGIGNVNFSTLLNQLEDRSNQIESLRKLVP